MSYTRSITATFLLLGLASFVGCTSKQDKPVANSAVPQEKAPASQEKTVAPVAVPPQNKQGSVVAPPQDIADAHAAADRVLAMMESGDFPAIYKGAADEFKQIGSEQQFVAKFQGARKTVGVLKKPQELSFGMIPGKGYVLVYRLENERYKTDLRLSFARSRSGKMELAGMNQHDEMKK